MRRKQYIPNKDIIKLLLLFLGPTFILYTVFYIYPFLSAFYISLFEWNGFSRAMNYIGLKNFVRLFNDEIVWKGLLNNVFFLVWGTLIIFVMSIFCAVCITRMRFRESGFYRVVFFFPNVLSIIVVGILWMFIYNPSFGLLNEILKSIRLDYLIRDWLGSTKMVMGSLVAPQAWMFIGFYMVLFIAAIINIPEEYFEASTIDGAGMIRQLLTIIFPLIWDTLRTALVFFVVNAFSRTFALVFVVTKGGPNRASELLTTYLYEQAFVNGNFGYATAIGVLLFVIVFIISASALRLTKQESIEY